MLRLTIRGQRREMGLGGVDKVSLASARDLAREACERRNRILEGFEATNGVFYRTVAGAQPLERISPLFKI